MQTDPLGFYSTQSLMSDPGREALLFDGLPHEVGSLRDVVEGLLIHVFWAGRYGVTLTDERLEEVQLRKVEDKLARIRELDPRPLREARPPGERLVGNCRDFTILLCSMLRHEGVPARARCGFAEYFGANHHEDHWVCEYWSEEGRWVMVDAQLDALQREHLKMGFDPLDVPEDQFLTAGRAWRACRTGKADPDTFGISDLHGLWFVRGNLLRDLASLNKVELLPWDAWGLVDKDDNALTEDDLRLLDRAADSTLFGNDRFEEARSLYLGEGSLRVPPVIRSYSRSGVKSVEL
ncbi:MAG TPA: transglutaminase-like domain-containing protein [Conexivisphaerales archaeon]|nr:transglutaminase-like domain-containing protein [Conexivisphaerales archaeon]